MSNYSRRGVRRCSGKASPLTPAHVNPHKLGSKATEDHLVTECDRCNEPVKHFIRLQVN